MRYTHVVEICENAAISEICGNRIDAAIALGQSMMTAHQARGDCALYIGRQSVT